MHLVLAVRVLVRVRVVRVALAVRVRRGRVVLVGPVVLVRVALGDRAIRVLVVRVLAVLVGRVRRGPVVLVRVALGDRVRRGRVVLVGPVVLVRVVLVGPVVLVRVVLAVRVRVLAVLVRVRVVRVALAGRVRRGPVVLVRVALGDRAIRAIRVLAVRVLAVLVGRVRRGLVVLVRVALGDRVIRAIRVLAGLAGLVGLADLVARRRLRMCNTATTTGVARSGAARGTHRTDSARRVTVHRLRLRRTASGGTADHPPEHRRPTGTGHRLLVAGTDRRRLVAGTHHGMGRRATSAGGRLITGRSTTTATTPLQCSIRCSVDGDTGTSATGSHCTDLTSTGLPLSSKAGGQLYLGWALETAVKACRPAGKECIQRDSVARCPAWLCTKVGRWQTSISADAT